MVTALAVRGVSDAANQINWLTFRRATPSLHTRTPAFRIVFLQPRFCGFLVGEDLHVIAVANLLAVSTQIETVIDRYLILWARAEDIGRA